MPGKRPFARTLNGDLPLEGGGGSVWLAFVGGASICSASEPYSYNGLRNRISGNVAPVFLGLWRAPPAGAVSAPCTPARCHTSFNCSCYVLKGCAHPSRRGDSSFSCAVPMNVGSTLSCYITTDVARVKKELSEPLISDFRDGL